MGEAHRESDDETVAALRAAVGGQVLAREPLARHTTMRLGGPAAAFVRAESVTDLVAVATVCAEHRREWLILGRGSNLLVAEAGWPGVVVTLGRGFRGIEVTGDRVEAGAAEPMPVLARATAAAGLGGLAFGIAIPGSLGGAVRMNAGAMGAEVADVLERANLVSLVDGSHTSRTPEQLGYRYRSSALGAHEVVVGAVLQLHRAHAAALEEQLRTYRAWRRAHQPVNEPSCGSVFRNPDGDAAGRLVDAAGLKGTAVGGVRVSERHANFFTVRPGSSADDAGRLVRLVQRRVRERFGVQLEPEVVLAGFGESGPDAGPDEGGSS